MFSLICQQNFQKKPRDSRKQLYTNDGESRVVRVVESCRSQSESVEHRYPRRKKISQTVLLGVRLVYLCMERRRRRTWSRRDRLHLHGLLPKGRLSSWKKISLVWARCAAARVLSPVLPGFIVPTANIIQHDANCPLFWCMKRRVEWPPRVPVTMINDAFRSSTVPCALHDVLLWPAYAPTAAIMAARCCNSRQPLMLPPSPPQGNSHNHSRPL